MDYEGGGGFRGGFWGLFGPFFFPPFWCEFSLLLGANGAENGGKLERFGVFGPKKKGCMGNLGGGGGGLVPTSVTKGRIWGGFGVKNGRNGAE